MQKIHYGCSNGKCIHRVPCYSLYYKPNKIAIPSQGFCWIIHNLRFILKLYHPFVISETDLTLVLCCFVLRIHFFDSHVSY